MSGKSLFTSELLLFSSRILKWHRYTEAKRRYHATTADIAYPRHHYAQKVTP